ncbi:prolyl-tRNA synthetase associated domain-containing protein [Parvularcula sp. ZS-1/3]|uniref:Prolyl-tRNA synthetase associated domain-containing protein n=1 Tax=Parvularcula mediterranea TaxID=2732508 RepID=A0A7Y3W525_9PROT|nr:prolyl-tRNA synthetase associated domain-containing protein [Parvularcula mediterranea]NNU16073.1 prolyl-tRNA synthetase associated domain-containing protein [Parvularcula mediterranea]
MDPERRLFARFEEMGIASETVEHDATATVAESAHLAETMPGSRSKSLLLEDKDGTLTLVTAVGRTKVDLKKVGEAVGARGRLSFAKPEVMEEVLGVAPGHLTPFALINDRSLRIETFVIDEALFEADPIWAHPLRNTASTGVTGEDLKRFAELHAKAFIVIGLAQG